MVEVVGEFVPSVFRSFSGSRVIQDRGSWRVLDNAHQHPPRLPARIGCCWGYAASYGRSVSVSLIGSGTFTLPEPTSKAITYNTVLVPVDAGILAQHGASRRLGPLLGCREADGHRAAAQPRRARTHRSLRCDRRRCQAALP